MSVKHTMGLLVFLGPNPSSRGITNQFFLFIKLDNIAFMSLRVEPSRQEVYALNLGGTPLGLPIYEPIPFRDGINVGRVGDIAFFDQEGGYQWVANAFDKDVIFIYV